MRRMRTTWKLSLLFLVLPLLADVGAQEPVSRKATAKKEAATPPLHLTVKGSKLDVYVQLTTSKPETGTRKITGSSQLAFASVKQGQKVILHLEGSSNDVFFPESMRGLVEETVIGSVNVIEYLAPEKPTGKDFTKSLRLHVDGVNCVVTLIETKGAPKTGIQKIQGSGVKANVRIRANQKIVIDLGGGNNRIIIPKALSEQVSERVGGVRNAVEYR